MENWVPYVHSTKELQVGMKVYPLETVLLSGDNGSTSPLYKPMMGRISRLQNSIKMAPSLPPLRLVRPHPILSRVHLSTSAVQTRRIITIISLAI